eukprot:gnl/TRDRNA2_/TRDRNA2_163388_c0_seq2.p1 gnl/TRDRNA2_/TRDRNA2_163388_c0~~gnl/TRDRNA2_/TRDRNA2_163388_c0_seq2.p1  ORF type:complete len:287 (-),score=12.41 gnl/TRDRNA2_/TRDRNA2_163388_c0_seq2:25-885(-)
MCAMGAVDGPFTTAAAKASVIAVSLQKMRQRDPNVAFSSLTPRWEEQFPQAPPVGHYRVEGPEKILAGKQRHESMPDSSFSSTARRFTSKASVGPGPGAYEYSDRTVSRRTCERACKAWASPCFSSRSGSRCTWLGPSEKERAHESTDSSKDQIVRTAGTRKHGRLKRPAHGKDGPKTASSFIPKHLQQQISLWVGTGDEPPEVWRRTYLGHPKLPTSCFASGTAREFPPGATPDEIPGPGHYRDHVINMNDLRCGHVDGYLTDSPFGCTAARFPLQAENTCRPEV